MTRVVSLGEAFHRERCAQIQSRLGALDLDGLLLLDAYNVTYASGFRHVPSERPLGLYIPARGEPILYVPLLEQEHAGAGWIGDVRTYFEYPGEEDAVRWMARDCGARRLGVDSLSQPRFAELCRMGIEVVVTPLVEQMRWVKTAEELALVRLAAGYADDCLLYIRDHAADIVRGGGTELDILRTALSATTAKMQTEIGDIFELYGGTVVGTVHSGARAALPHGRPIERIPLAGETLIAGIGAMVGGYHAESGATFILGAPTADQMHCLNAAAACNDAAVSALKPGAVCAKVNDAALAVLHEARLGAFIRHRIGHGMGLQGHEAPWLAPGDTTLVMPGMVFSNEPGIYRPGIDGYRTINTMIVTDGLAEVPSRFLTEHPPERRILPL